MQDLPALTWKDVQGLQTFVRLPETRFNHRETDSYAVIEWLRGLNLPDRRTVCTSGIPLAQMDSDLRDHVLHMAGFDQNLPIALLDHGPTTGVRLQISPYVTYTNSQMGKATRLPISLPNKERQIEGEWPDPFACTPLEKPAQGALDFGKGEVLPLSDILRRAGEAFRIEYAVDQRLTEQYYSSQAQRTNPLLMPLWRA